MAYVDVQSMHGDVILSMKTISEYGGWIPWLSLRRRLITSTMLPWFEIYVVRWRLFFHFDTTTFQFRPKKYFFECESAPSTQDCDDPPESKNRSSNVFYKCPKTSSWEAWSLADNICLIPGIDLVLELRTFFFVPEIWITDKARKCSNIEGRLRKWNVIWDNYFWWQGLDVLDMK